MDALATVAFALAAGLTFSGFAGTAIEIIAGRKLSLREPFVSIDNISRSLVLVLLAGPFMALNEALAALREHRIDAAAFAAVACFCLAWFGAIGVFVLGLVESAQHPVGCTG
jgi:hypothetical protein